MVLGCALLAAAAGASRAADTDVRVGRLWQDGREVERVEGELVVRLVDPEGRLQGRALKTGQVLAPGARIWAGRGVTIELTRAEPVLRMHVEPQTELKLVRNDRAGAEAEVREGRATFSLLRQLNFFFGVSNFKRVLALARGTRFTVDARRSCEGGVDAGPCVFLALEEGRLAIETRRPLRLASAEAGGGGGAGEESTIVQTDAMEAGDTRLLALAPDRFALHFESAQAAERHFAAELRRARASADAPAVWQALRNLLVVHRTSGRTEDELRLAEEGLALAQAADDRPWQFRFLIDQAFAVWRLRRDATAAALFERAFAMDDVLGAVDARTDLAALYARYSSIRFETRNRQRPEDDLAAAEKFALRALRLREPAPGEAPTLDFANSLYGLGMLMRIGRQDDARSHGYLERALAARRAALDGRDDLTTAEVMSEAALTLESVVRASALRADCAAGAGDDPFAPVHRHFERSLAMLERLSPQAPLRSWAAVARRRADFDRRHGDWLAATCRLPEAAAASWRVARDGYTRSLAVWSRQGGNTAAERRFAWRGLAWAALGLRDWPAAEAAARESYALALSEACGPVVGSEAPSVRWIAELLDILAGSAEGRGAAEAAQAHRRAAGRWRASEQRCLPEQDRALAP